MEDNSYKPGHPWYYVLGGQVLPPSVILVNVKKSGYQGYRKSYIDEADRKAEPQRSIALRCLRDEVLNEFWANISRYREVVRTLHQHRKTAELQRHRPICADIHQSVSLKHNHLYNDFAHLIKLDDLLSRQPDLFDF